MSRLASSYLRPCLIELNKTKPVSQFTQPTLDKRNGVMILMYHT